MPDSDVKCPKCGEKFKIGQEVIARSVRENIENELKKKMELAFADRLKQEKEQLEKNIKLDQNKEIDILKTELELKSKKIDDLREQELKLIKDRSALEDAKKEIELVTERRLVEEKKIIEERLRKELEEKKNFEVMELRKQLEDTKKSLTEAQRKAQQGSMQTQGEVMELALRAMLEKRFPQDIIEDVAKGASGADVIQKVMAPNGEVAGIIAWESKQTKAWVEDWITKLKDDGHRVKANLLVLATNVLPKEVDRFGQYKGVWVTDHSSIAGIASALRNNLLSVYSVALSNENSQDKAMILYKHLTSQAFINRVQSLSETYISMVTMLEKEKTAMANIWNVRQKQIERLSTNTRQLFSEIGSIAGGQFTGIEMLEELTSNILPESKKKKNTIDDSQANLF